MLVEAAWAAAKAPGPLQAFFVRIRARRGHQIVAVAVARKLTVLCWHLLKKAEGGRARHCRLQDPRDAASSRSSATERQPAWASVCLQSRHCATARC